MLAHRLRRARLVFTHQAGIADDVDRHNRGKFSGFGHGATPPIAGLITRTPARTARVAPKARCRRTKRGRRGRLGSRLRSFSQRLASKEPVLHAWIAAKRQILPLPRRVPRRRGPRWEGLFSEMSHFAWLPRPFSYMRLLGRGAERPRAANFSGGERPAAPANPNRPTMANPFEFIQQVRAEASKVVWPTRRETLITTGLVLLLVVFAAFFRRRRSRSYASVVGSRSGRPRRLSAPRARPERGANRYRNVT